MQHIVDHPEQHDQTVYVNDCGTAFCFAGTAAMLSGWNIVQIRHRPIWAFEELLGLTSDEADILFDSINTVAALQLMVKDLVNDQQLSDHDKYLYETKENT